MIGLCEQQEERLAAKRALVRATCVWWRVLILSSVCCTLALVAGCGSALDANLPADTTQAGDDVPEEPLEQTLEQGETRNAELGETPEQIRALQAIHGEIIERGVTIETDRGVIDLPRGLKTRGHAGMAIFDETTGKVAWPAMTCLNPKCPRTGERHGEFFFTHPVPRATIGKHGYIKVPKGVPKSEQVAICPACNRGDAVVKYSTPNVVGHRSALTEELRQTRAARTPDGTYPEGFRTPIEVQRELALLPRVYILPE